MKNFKLLCLVVIVYALFSNHSFSQFSADIDGNLIIESFNGEIKYNYPISNKTIDGHPLNVSLNYTNLKFIAFQKYVDVHLEPCIDCDGWSKFSRIHPAWVLGVNGFAVQVLGYNFGFMTLNENDNLVYNFNNENLFNFLIDGYDFCNRMQRINNPDDQDIIRLLKSDGSTLELRNPIQYKDVNNENDSNLYIGTYYENAINSTGFGIVEYETKYWPSYFSQYANDTIINSFKPRILRYYSGDGLEYVFREHPAPYGTREYIITNRNYNVNPTIFYLEEINSEMGKLSDFKRAYHYSTESQIDKLRGRSPIMEFNGHKITHNSLNDLFIETFDRTIKIKFVPRVWGNFGDSYYENHPCNCDDVNSSFYQGSGMGLSQIYGNNWNWLADGHDLLEMLPQHDESISYYDYADWSDLAFVTEIIDPENRRTNFKYECIDKNWKNFPYPFDSTFSMSDLRLSTINEPTQSFSIVYKRGDSIIDRNLLNRDDIMNIDYDFMNVVSEVDNWEQSHEDADSLYMTKLKYSYYELDSFPRLTKIIKYDYKKSDLGVNLYDSSITEYLFKRFNRISAFKENEYQPYYCPDLSYTYLYQSVSIVDNMQRIKTTDMKTVKDITGDNTLSIYQYYPTQSKSFIVTDLDTVLTSKLLYNYIFENINSFNENNDLAKAFGYIPKSIDQYTISLTNEIDTLFRNHIDYINIPFANVDFIRLDTIWLKDTSEKVTDYYRYKLGKDTTCLIFDTYYDTVKYAPSLYGLLKYSVSYDKNGDIISGRIFTYDTSFHTISPNYRRGALLSDSVIIKGGLDTLLVAKYTYTGGWYRNFLKEIETANGVVSSNYYRYEDIPVLNGNLPTGKKLFNNNSYSNSKLSKIFFDFESPIANDLFIRKYMPDGSLDSLFMRSYIEKNYYGQVSNFIDPNGWLWKSSYDLNGRKLKEWHPFDFPLDAECYCDIYGPEDNFIKLFGETENIIIRDTVYKETESTVDLTESYSLCSTHGTYSYLPPEELSLGKETGKSYRKIIDTVYTDSIPILSLERKIKLKYFASDCDPIHQALDISDAKIRMAYTGSDLNECMILKISSNKFGLEERVMIGCPVLGLLENVPESIEIDGKEIATFNIDLMQIVDSLMLMSDGDSLVFTIESQGIGGMIEFINNSDDMMTGILLEMQHPCSNNDYTFAYNYNDSSRTMKMSAKIDDLLHTNSYDWEKTWNDFDGRYTDALGFFGANNRLKQINNIIGSPTDSIRHDVISYNFIGNDRTESIIDPNFNQIKYNWKNGYVNETIHQDSLMTHTDLFIFKPGATNPENILDITGTNFQDFYGVCYAISTTDEISIKKLVYKDAFGRLRRTVENLYDVNKMTKYEYDEIGNLISITKPNNDTTRYWYDNYGRLKYKYQSDIGFISYAYDLYGNLRFSQTAQQSIDSLMTFIQYDDLGRITIIGEAKIDSISTEPVLLESGNYSFGRFTDNINPNILHYSGFGDYLDYGLLSANMTIYQGSSSTYNFNVNFDLINILPTSIQYYFPEDSVILPPYSFAIPTSTTFTPGISGTDNFENIGNYPEFINTAISYDNFPESIGAIWLNYPDSSIWNRLAPTWNSENKIRNRLGKQIAVAYRDDFSENFHYVTFSYDPRGRIEGVIRYTENLGFDAVYYNYNSLNQLIKIKVMDPERQFITWLDYDDNGRLDSVWSAVSPKEHGLKGIYTSWNDFDSLCYRPDFAPRPDTADVYYSYNKLGEVDTIRYIPVNVNQYFKYSVRGWLDSMVAIRNIDTLFYQNFERKLNGEIITQNSKQLGQNKIEQNYSYDGLSRLTSWTDQTNSLQFGYDIVGNRLWKNNGVDSIAYSYTDSNHPNRLNYFANATDSTLFSYNEIGSVTEILSKQYNQDSLIWENKKSEQFTYSSGGFLKKFVKLNLNNEFNGYKCDGFIMEGVVTTFDPDKWIWQYRSSPFGGREQKKLMVSPHGDSCEYIHPREYYLKGAAGEMYALYHGIQTATAWYTGGGRRIYMYPSKYIANNGDVTYNMNTSGNTIESKDYAITDNIGSIRCVITKYTETGNITVKGFDFKPYGDSLSATGPENYYKGYTGKIKNYEYDYKNMGARLFDPETGRFLSADPLLEYFPGESPYSYAFNSPINFADPSGLFPEEEKGMRDELQYAITRIDVDDMGNIWEYTIENVGIRDSPLEPGESVSRKWKGYDWSRLGGGGGGYGGGGGGYGVGCGGGGGGGGGYAGMGYNGELVIPIGGTLRIGFLPAPKHVGTSSITVDNGFDPESKGIRLPPYQEATSLELAVYTGVSLSSYMLEILGPELAPIVIPVSITSMVVVLPYIIPLAVIAGDTPIDHSMDTPIDVSLEGTRVKERKTETHHIATISSPYTWTPKFVEIFTRAGMTLNDPDNLMPISWHSGRHTNAYHLAVYARLNEATFGLSGKEANDKLRGTLRQLRFEIITGTLKLYKFK